MKEAKVKATLSRGSREERSDGVGAHGKRAEDRLRPGKSQNPVRVRVIQRVSRTPPCRRGVIPACPPHLLRFIAADRKGEHPFSCFLNRGFRNVLYV